MQYQTTNKKILKLFKNRQDTLHRDLCKNALTGATYEYLGSTKGAFDHLFVYRNVTGCVNLANPFNLYYDCPEQCEKHLNIKINDKIKQSWKKKMDNLKAQYLSKEEQKMTQQYVMVK
jgi:hypothetical protein